MKEQGELQDNYDSASISAGHKINYCQNSKWRNMPLSKTQCFVQFHFVDFCTEYQVLFFEENCILKVKVVLKKMRYVRRCLSAHYITQD